MLGPALARLFKELDSRRDGQTSYEKRLFQELLALKASTEAFPEHPLGRAPDLSNFAGGFGGSESLRGIAGVVVGRQDDDSDDDSRLQMGCKKLDCPNREFK